MNNNLKYLSFLFLAFLLVSNPAFAAPGDILFEDDFEGTLAQWTIDNSGGGDASIGTETANSGINSMRIRWDPVTATSSAIAAAVAAAELDIWIRRGADSFSENPDNNEDLVLEYLNSSGSYNTLETFDGNDTAGEVFNRTYSLPANALHNGLQIRLRYLQGSGVDWDYWHIDDVIVTERAVGAIGGLIGEWRFDELFWNGINNEVLDNSGNDLHLTAFDAATTNVDPAIAGNPGTCSYGVFNGSISFIQRDDDTSTSDSLLDIPNTLTITVWINTNVIPNSGLKSILSKDENYEFHINSNGEIYWWWNWGTLTTSGLNLQTNRWYHVAITWRSGEQVIYVDGVPRATSTRTGTLQINNDPLQIGQDLDIPERFFDGYIDEVRIYENVLTPAQVNQVMAETHPCSSSSVCTSSYIDKFDLASYSNSDGLDPWTGDWIEIDDDGSPTSGNVRITGGELRMEDQPNTGGEPSVIREFDLSGAIAASLKLDLDTSGNLEGGDRFDISISPDGGTNWTVLESFSNDLNNTFTYDITAYASVNTQIRLRIENGYGNGGEYIDIDNISILGTKNCGPSAFRIIHDGAGINCLPEAIQIRAEDSSGNPVADYIGLINLSTANNFGNWTVTDINGNSSDLAQGSLSDTPGDNNGAATYQFVAGDAGTVTLYLQDTVAETTNIGVNEGGTIFDDNSEGDITFRPLGFVFSPTPIATQVAGRDFNLTLTAAGQTPSQPECGVIEEYDGSKSINFWSTYTSSNISGTQVAVNGNAVAGSEAASSGQNITFNNGVAVIPVRYDDVGEISLQAKDDVGIGEPPAGNADEILLGGINPFVVRPFGYDIQVNGDPYANDGNSPVFTSAGSAFDMTIRSVLWQASDDLNNDGIPDPQIDSNADGVPDSGGILSDNGVTPNINQINETINLSPAAQVVTNSNGSLTTASLSSSAFASAGVAGEGTFTLSQSWNEVGILQIDAIHSSFMGSGENVIGQRINIGRFIPDSFLLTIDPVVAACGTFTYGGYFDGVNVGLDRNGQAFDVSGSITARSAANTDTQNYAGVFAKLVNTDFNALAYNQDLSALASGRINFAAAPLSFVNGVSGFTSGSTDFQFASESQAFNLRIDLSAADSDGVSSQLESSNTIATRLGRMRLMSAYGPETADLEMQVLTEYFDGSGWVRNSADNCSTYVSSNISFDPTSYTDGLNAGETAPFAPLALSTVVNGQSPLGSGIWFSAPGENNFGSVRGILALTGQDWLTYDWDGDLSLDPASGILNFGYYRGSDRVIYWREIRN